MKYNINDYIKRCEELNVEFIGTHKENHKGTMIDYICNIHKDKGIQSCDWSHFRIQKKSCPYCSGRYKTNEEVQKEVKDKNVKIISKYLGNEKPITCECLVCGNVWETLPKVLTTNGSGCPICGKNKASKNEMKPHEDFVNDLNAVNKDIEILGTYNGTHKKIKCRCKIDGTIWFGYPANLLNGSAGCPNCNISTNEKKMVDILTSKGLNINQQHKINGCVYKYHLKFDAFDVSNSIAFEYNGEQHYRPVDFAGKGEHWAKEQFELTKSRDNAKIKYCKENKIPIIIVPYWERNNMESFIIDELNKIGVKVN